MKKLLLLLFSSLFLFAASGCSPDESEPEPEKPSSIEISTDLKDGARSATQNFSFFCRASAPKEVTLVVDALGAQLSKGENGSFSAKLQTGENLIFATAESGAEKISQTYKIYYIADSTPIIEHTMKDGDYRSDKFNFQVRAQDARGNAVCPSFALLEGTPEGVPLAPNGDIRGGLLIGGELKEKSGDAPENCDRYQNGDTVDAIAYAAWADAASKTVYFKVNLPDAEPNFTGWFVIVCEDASSARYTAYVRMDYKNQAEGEEDTAVGTVTVTVEVFTLGHGYLVEPVLVPIYAEDNNARLLTRVLAENGYSYAYSGDLESSFYLNTIFDGDAAEAEYPIAENAEPAHMEIPLYSTNFPDCLLDKMTEEGAVGSRAELADASYVREGDFGVELLYGLGEFDFYQDSGWMYSVNGEFPGVGASLTSPADGDVIRWQFTLYGYGRDVGAGNSPSELLFPPSEKEELTKRVSTIRAAGKEKDYGLSYVQALETLQLLNAEQAEIDELLRALAK